MVRVVCVFGEGWSFGQPMKEVLDLRDTLGGYKL